MHSLKTKIAAVTISAVIITMIIATVFGVIAIRQLGISSSEQLLRLLCEAGEKNLNSILLDVEQDVQTISAYVEADLDGLDDQSLQEHLDRVSEFFPKTLYKTNGILTYYYRIDPELTTNVEGFWFVNSDGKGFRSYKVTDITKYDTNDQSQIVWFTVPKATSEPVWLPPYVTENLNAMVISYNMPIYMHGEFVGVVGIELDYEFMADLVNNITLYDNGYAFINDEKGELIYHPYMESMVDEIPPEVPNGIKKGDSFVEYTYQGVKKIAVSLPLCNGNRLNVTVPIDEINASWQRWIISVIIVFGILLAAFIIFMMEFTKKITKPLQELTKVAEQIEIGNYDNILDYKGKDEIGVLTRTINRVSLNLKNYITDLNDLAYADALTSLHNKGAFDACIKKIQIDMNRNKDDVAFAVCIFDCNNLKIVNDQNGHDKGDIYLKRTAEIICDVFDHSPVYRVGGDEFAAILVERDYKERDGLLQRFDERCSDQRAKADNPWEQVNVARGMAVYDPNTDESAYDVVRRADKRMYENKLRGKSLRQVPFT